VKCAMIFRAFEPPPDAKIAIFIFYVVGKFIYRVYFSFERNEFFLVNQAEIEISRLYYYAAKDEKSRDTEGVPDQLFSEEKLKIQKLLFFRKNVALQLKLTKKSPPKPKKPMWEDIGVFQE
jgi:hypothetical protein